ncbi:hypothetical protein SPONN_1755 [uncultured Candidatus Thioglobus sp.]|nr:hypothetical protein SPONN_1755 [uncultured Candidatus Thioglobus sp.]
MPRKPRINPVGIAQHIIARGNNRQVCFTSEYDMALLYQLPKRLLKKAQSANPRLGVNDQPYSPALHTT